MTDDDDTDIKAKHSNDYCKSWLDSACLNGDLVIYCVSLAN